MVEKGIRGGICHSIHIYANANNKYMKLYDKNKELSDDKNKELWAMSQKLPVNNFEWIKDTSQFDREFIKAIMKKVINDIYLKLVFNIFIDHFTRKNKGWKTGKASR